MTAPEFAQATPDFDNVRRDIHRRFGASMDEATIDRLLDSAIERATAGAKIQEFLPALVEREVTEELQATLAEQGIDPTPRKEVIFVSERNAGRSQMAASIMAHRVGRDILFRTVGLKAAGDCDNTVTEHHEYDVFPEVVEVLQEKGYPTDVFYQKQLEPRPVHRANVVVLMGVDEAPNVPADRVVTWDIADPKDQSLEKIREIRDDIEAKVDALLAELA